MASRKAKYHYSNLSERCVICVSHGMGLAGGKQQREIFVKVQVGKKTILKTRHVTGSEPRFSEFVFLDEIPSSLTFLIGENKAGKYGECTLTKIKSLPLDIVSSCTLPVERGKKGGDLATGSLTVNIIPGKLKPAKASHRAVECGEFYEGGLNTIKTGDLIAYSDIGPLGDYIRARSGKQWSHVGIALKIPNPVTTFVELFVIEVTQNTENYLDSWHDNPLNGVTVLRLEERLHQFGGAAIAHNPLKNALHLNQEKALLKYVKKLHVQRSHQYVDPAPHVPDHHLPYLKDFRIIPKYIRTLTDLSSTIFAMQAYVKASVLDAAASLDDVARLTPSKLTRLPIFAPPTLLFCKESLTASFQKYIVGVPVQMTLGFSPEVFSLSSEWNQPFPFTAVIQAQKSSRMQKVSEWQKDEELSLRNLAEEQESDSELFDSLDDGTDAVYNPGDMVDELDSESSFLDSSEDNRVLAHKNGRRHLDPQQGLPRAPAPLRGQ
eukprot:TRINITY_DN3168_c0_g1_i1.p1 TRINITY_DN3168_c0_g1~~TRINITY_DN3168_c0_g1_i1.p1  ORF type:complete len:503 (+),score=105.42 TRINITY_DN3168_c0_g1_i1:35-1510(+)